MKTKQLMQSGILNTGEPKHYSSWNLPEVPKLNMSMHGGLSEALYRRQKAYAPKISRGKAGWLQVWHALRKG
jgi:predicted metal-dependent hydrolase